MITTEKELRKLLKNQNKRLEQLIKNLKEGNSETGTPPPDSP
jgi:hypothetical protein